MVIKIKGFIFLRGKPKETQKSVLHIVRTLPFFKRGEVNFNYLSRRGSGSMAQGKVFWTGGGGLVRPAADDDFVKSHYSRKKIFSATIILWKKSICKLSKIEPENIP